MKNFFIILTLFLSVDHLQAQATKSNNIGSNGVLSDSRILDIFENIKNKANSATKAIGSIKGSPYFDKSFKSSQVEYFGKTLKDNIYLRYNAFRDEMEMGKTANQNSSLKAL